MAKLKFSSALTNIFIVGAAVTAAATPSTLTWTTADGFTLVATGSDVFAKVETVRISFGGQVLLDLTDLGGLNLLASTLLGGFATNILHVGDDRITGDADGEAISAGDGADVVNSGAGNDWISGDNGIDTLSGDDGNDTILGGSGSDRIYGGNGDDAAWGGAADDLMDGGDGIDTLSGDDGHDTIFGGAGSDKIYGGNGFDAAWGGDGDDLVTGGAGDDTLSGDDGQDTIFGGAGRDDLYGGNGDDDLYGGAWGDIVSGGYGRDYIVGGLGRDVLAGDQDGDFFAFQALSDSKKGADRDVIVDFERGCDLIDLSALDANTYLRGNQAFKYIGLHAFSGKGGEVRYVAVDKPGSLNGSVLVAVDVNGDRKADMEIQVKGLTALDAGDFIL